MKYLFPNYIYKKKILKLINQIINYKGKYTLEKEFKNKNNKKLLININQELGYLFLKNGMTISKNLLNNLEKYCNENKINEMKKKNNEKSFMINLLDEKDVVNIPGLLDHVLDDKILDLVSNYLKTIPFLAYIKIFYSLPNQTTESSQLFHCDTEDDNQIKLFFYLDDVDENNGPFVFIPKNKSLIVMRKNKYQGKRLKDDEVYSYINPNDAIKFIGEKGSGLAIDTCRCLHYGSRENKKTRKLLMVQFTNHFANLYYKSNLNKYLDYNKIEKSKHIYCKPHKRLF